MPGCARRLAWTLITAYRVEVIVSLFFQMTRQLPKVHCNASRIATLVSLHLKGGGLGRNLETVVRTLGFFLSLF